jgi:MFS family permease
MVVADLVRAVLVAAMVLPELPLWLLWALVGAMTFLAGPFKAAQQALLPDVLPDEEKYIVGQSIRTITNQTAQLAGFAGGGTLVALINPSFGLTLDAVTFLFSAVILRLGVRRRPASVTGAPSGLPAYLGAIATQARVVWRNRRLRTLLALSWLAGFHITPEALAAPYAASLGFGAGAVGLLMASDPAGSVLGVFVFAKWVPEHLRARMIGLLGVLAGVPLALCALQPNLAVSMVLFSVLGMLGSAFIVQTSASFTLGLPAGQRSHGTGLFSSGLIATQGLGALAAGPVADHMGPVYTVALSGALGTIVAVPIAVGWHRVSTTRRAEPAVVITDD